MTLFQGFCPTSFEQFIRVLALQILGPGVTVFGAGPDGGREACFRGTVPYPFPPAQQWSGYGVIQAKFKQKRETTAKDQQWAATQLRSELERWLKRDERHPKPDYLIFCTNVELTSAPRGGRARIEKLLAAGANALGLKDVCIWDGVQLRGFVDRYESIRSRFSYFLTTGDLLGQFANRLSWHCDSDSVLTTYLCRELLQDEDARLSQAGDRSEDRIKLADVFVDLPVADIKPLAGDRSQQPIQSLHELATIASGKLDPLTLHEHTTRLAQDGQRMPLHSRYLLLGGPGSGKSTVVQFLAQINRAALLDRRPKHRLEGRVKNIVDALRARCRADLTEWPATPRFPIRIELNSFAQALASKEDGIETLSAYLRRNLSRDVQISHAELRSWLQMYPWLVVLDGLDEVPSSTNRREVVAAIQHFLAEARDLEADLLVVASTRPDGYHGELDGEDVTSRVLLPLPRKRALAYARRYVDAKSAGSDDPRSTALMTIIGKAIKSPLVARLMTSPLQVTFMVAVIAAIGRPSESRWQLFTDYYRTIYERELHKAVRPFNRILHERRQDIDALHHRIGFLLQARGEFVGGLDAALTAEEFEGLVDAALREDGLDHDELAEQRRMIVDAAKMRLVFITSRRANRLSFDVRSLQEYMAAAYLTDTDAADILQRLKAIARSAHWRNTLLFAIGRFFIEPRMRQHRDLVRLLCDDLNREDPPHANVKSGSRLALEILESGVVGNVPHVSRSLAECALKLLEIPPGLFEKNSIRLAGVHEEFMQPEYHCAVSIWLGQTEKQRTLSAWLLLLRLEQSGVAWAAEMARTHWPTSSSAGLMIMERWFGGAYDNQRTFTSAYWNLNDGHRHYRALSEMEVQRLDALIPRLPLRTCYQLISRTRNQRACLRKTRWLHALRRLFSKRRLEVSVSSAEVPDCLTLFLVRMQPRHKMRSMTRLLSQIDDTMDESWRQLQAVLQFTVEPTAGNLAAALRTLHRLGDDLDRELCMQFAPWPLTCCLSADSSQCSLETLAIQAEEGRLGDTDHWLSLQKHWRTPDLYAAEFIDSLHDNPLPLIGATVRIGADVAALMLSTTGVVQLLAGMLEDLPHSYARYHLIDALVTIMALSPAAIRVDPARVHPHLIAAARAGTVYSIPFTAETMQGIHADYYDALGSSTNLFSSSLPWALNQVSVDPLLLEFCAHPTRVGLLTCVVACIASGATLLPATLLQVTGHEVWNEHRWAHLFVQICRTDLEEQAALTLAAELPGIIESDSAPGSLLRLLILTLDKRAANAPTLEPILLAACALISATQWELLADAEHVKYRFSLTQTSELPALLSGSAR
ncbi:NACHT domain-containing protein [Steroidobacter flavus]|uniref:NACHT domain-containing protein n=1 Tax=Steroidobacter flavus TaxID=1842136 RepID=A0ABV8T6F0_9GAMM